MFFVCGVFFIAGWSVADALGIFLLPVIGGAWFFICRLLGGIVGLLLVYPARAIKIRGIYLGTSGLVLLAILTSCGASSVGNLGRLSQATVSAYRIERGEVDGFIPAGGGGGCLLLYNQVKLGLLTIEEAQDISDCEFVAIPEEEGGGLRLRVPKPSPFLFVWELGKLILVGMVAVLVFALRVMPWRKEAAQQDLVNRESGAKEKGTDKETSTSEPGAKMTELRALVDAGLITEEDYRKKKEEILAEL